MLGNSVLQMNTKLALDPALSVGIHVSILKVKLTTAVLHSDMTTKIEHANVAMRTAQPKGEAAPLMLLNSPRWAALNPWTVSTSYQNGLK